MIRKKLMLILCGLLPVLAQATTASHILVAPHCLVAKSHATYQTLATDHKLALIQVDDHGLNAMIAAKDQRCGGFMNVTEQWHATHSLAKNFLAHYTQPTLKKMLHTEYRIQYAPQVNQLLSLLNPQMMWSNLTILTQFKDRYPNSKTGIQASEWFKTQMEDLAKLYNRDDVMVTLVKTGHTYKQPSVVVKIGTSNAPGIVMGAHMDTLLSDASSTMPGADDDGSGAVTVLQLAHVLISSNMSFKKPIYLIWYAAEEEGLVGSQNVVNDFKRRNIPIEDVMQFDMTGYAPQNDPTLWLMTDYTDQELTSYLETLITTYVKKPVKYSACGYACSDHATWTLNGYRAAIPFEAEMENYDPEIHTAQDTITLLSLEHMTDFAKLAIAFAVERAEPVQ